MNHKETSANNSIEMSDSQKSSDSDIDCEALVKNSDNESQSTSGQNAKYNNPGHTSKIDSTDFSSDFKVQSVIISQILQQLQQIGKKIG